MSQAALMTEPVSSGYVPTHGCPELVDKHGVAAMCGVSVDTVERRLQSLPKPFRLGRKMIWTRDAILEHIRRAERVA